MTNKKLGHKSENESVSQEEILFGRNAVQEALCANSPINKILFAGENKGSMAVISALAREKRVVMSETTKNALTELCGTPNHQGVMAYIAPRHYAEPEALLDIAKEKGEPPFLIILDEIQDPHNFGAILRTADAVGAHGVVIPKRRSVQLTGTVAKASAGAAEYVPVARVTNIPSFLKSLKDAGLWIYGTDLNGETEFFDADLKGPVALVIGSEGNGMGPLVRKQCDVILTIPMMGQVSSLNASVAAGVVMYEIFKQRRNG